LFSQDPEPEPETPEPRENLIFKFVRKQNLLPNFDNDETKNKYF
jgi:hypothetical protein